MAFTWTPEIERRADELKMIGNGVVTQQAIAALSMRMDARVAA